MDSNIEFSREDIQRLVPEGVVTLFRDDIFRKRVYYSTYHPIKCSRLLLEARLEIESLKKELIELKKK